MPSRALFSSTSVEWPTPKALYAALDAEFGFTLDPCPIDGVWCGLDRTWIGERVFCNPPYGPAIGAWLSKRHEPVLAVYLLPARTDTRWFHGFVLPEAEDIRFLRGRLNFGDEPRRRATFPSMIVVYRAPACEPKASGPASNARMTPRGSARGE